MPLLDSSNSPDIAEHVRYRISIVADYFHQVPHIDVNLQAVNATFDPHNNIYLESLGILVAIPAFWLIITLFAFLIFFLCRCCDSNTKKKKKITPLKWILAFFALLCCGALSLGLFGNDQAHSGLLVVQKATQEMENVVKSVRNETLYLEQVLDNNIREDVEQLSILFSGPLPNATVRSMTRETIGHMRANISQGLAKTKDMNIKMKALDMRNLPKWIQIVEFFRWPGTIGVLCVLMLTCLLLLWGVIRHSRCLLILFSVLGLLSVVLCWVLVSLYFGISVASSDFCLNPEPFFYRMAGNNEGEKAAVEFYMTCSGLTESPFLSDIREGTAAIDDLQRMTQALRKVADQYLPQKEVHTLLAALETRLTNTENTLRRMTTLLECTTIQNEYLNAMEAVCSNTLEGLALMLTSAAASGLLFTILIWIASHTWIHIRSRAPPTEAMNDEDHPFLPASSVITGGTTGRSSGRNTYAFLKGGGSVTGCKGTPIGGKGVSTGPITTSSVPLTSKSNARLAYLYDANNFFPTVSSLHDEGHSHSGYHRQNSRGNGREDQAFLHARYTPPPAYDHLTSSSARQFHYELPTAPTMYS